MIPDTSPAVTYDDTTDEWVINPAVSTRVAFPDRCIREYVDISIYDEENGGAEPLPAGMLSVDVDISGICLGEPIGVDEEGCTERKELPMSNDYNFIVSHDITVDELVAMIEHELSADAAELRGEAIEYRQIKETNESLNKFR